LKLCSLNYTSTIFISECKLTRTIQWMWEFADIYHPFHLSQDGKGLELGRLDDAKWGRKVFFSLACIYQRSLIHCIGFTW
jgi:hypothetical protein